MGLSSPGSAQKSQSSLLIGFSAANRWYYTNMPDGKYFSKVDNNKIKCLKKCKVRIKGVLGAYPERNSVGIRLNGDNMESFGYTGSSRYKEIDFEKDISVGDIIEQSFYHGNTAGDLSVGVSIDIL